MRKVLAQITMNAGDGIPGSVIKSNLLKYARYFDLVVVVDGELTDEARRFYNQFTNLIVVNSPWRDSYVDQYRAWSRIMDDGDWVLYLDCDEIPSKELLLFLESKKFTDLAEKYNTLCLPCVLHLTDDGKSFYAVDPDPLPEYEGQWMKNILVKKDKCLDFQFFGSHVIPTHRDQEKACYIPYPYFHMKTLESFVYNDCWQAFLHPQGQGYNEVDARLFKMFSKFDSVKEFKKATKEKSWSPMLEKFAWDRRHQKNNAVSRLAWTYWILEGHPMPEVDDFMRWDNVKNFVLDEDKMKNFSMKIKGVSLDG